MCVHPLASYLHRAASASCCLHQPLHQCIVLTKSACSLHHATACNGIINMSYNRRPSPAGQQLAAAGVRAGAAVRDRAEDDGGVAAAGGRARAGGSHVLACLGHVALLVRQCPSATLHCSCAQVCADFILLPCFMPSVGGSCCKPSLLHMAWAVGTAAHPPAHWLGRFLCWLHRQYAAHVRVHFLTNLAVAGGLTLLQSLGAGRCVGTIYHAVLTAAPVCPLHYVMAVQWQFGSA